MVSSKIKQMFAELSNSPILSKAFRNGILDFAGKEVVPLQAADTLAYEVFKQVENQIVDRGEKCGVRLSVKNLMRPQDPNYLKYWDRARLTEWLSECERRGGVRQTSGAPWSGSPQRTPTDAR
jgi:hypothetical protein